ncbi:hypothetical protein MCAP1_001119 [Malassezia caprae]|uniref:STAS domain-containing protein n=1 Tax=Malassezia caprae TaxID=1381934 RepID=A0AAF0IUQ3_9BASI|nr:hypothetical protein MCAP1_001119 [Malassezia caprae]
MRHDPFSTGMWKRAKGIAKKIVAYDDTEANRLGVPMVGVKDYVREHWRNPRHAAFEYVESLFPIRRWILSYNLSWLIGDLIAGITVALVLVPQSMSYAKVAGVPPQFGLYSSFVGVVIYALFATSKDVTIGPVAVMSLQTHSVIQQVNSQFGPNEQVPPEVIASALAFLCGIITLGLGLLRIGWIVEFIPAPAVAGFMTGSALSIGVGQFPTLFGERDVDTNGAFYQIVIDFFKNLPDTRIDAAMGIPALVFLYVLRGACSYVARRYPKYARIAFFVSVMRSAIVILVLTVASRIWLGHYDSSSDYPIKVIGHVPRGFKNMGQPQLPTSLLQNIGPTLPASVILLLLEHIAISKSFGRVNNYKINPNQELIAIGVTNLVGPCFGGYAATGSFSRSAIKSKSGVRTPLAGWITAIIVIIAIYALSGVFQWIPNAALSAVIIHAVGDLIATPPLLYKFWLMNPLELVIFFAAVIVTVFTSVDYGVYTSVAASAALLLIRIARPRGNWLGVVRVEHCDPATDAAHQRTVFVPMENRDGLRDPSVQVLPPAPGVFVYRVEESFTYPNASHMAEIIGDKIKAETCRGRIDESRRGDRPWNDPGPPNRMLLRAARALTFYYHRHKDAPSINEEYAQTEYKRNSDERPPLHALILDFGSVSNVDSTSVQVLVDLRNSLERYSGHPVQFHFAHILSPWIRRALLAGGFGTGRLQRHVTEIASVVQQGDARPIVGPEAEERPSTPSPVVKSPAHDLESQNDAMEAMDRLDFDIRNLDAMYAQDSKPEHSVDPSIVVPIMWNNELTPYFHLDLAAALSAAEGSLPNHPAQGAHAA